jgi:transposase
MFHVVAVGADLCTESVQTFQAFSSDLQRMADWLVATGIKTVAIESTGVYWVPDSNPRPPGVYRM